MKAAEQKRANALNAELVAAKKEEAELWHRYRGGAFEQAYHRKATETDVRMEIRLRRRTRDPEMIRNELAMLGIGPVRHGEEA